MNQTPPCPKFQWDIFCRVIDNFGDIGVCWRLCVNLAQRGQSVRLWVDDTNALAWMAPHGAPGVQVLRWTTPFDLCGVTPGNVLVEAFGCEVASEFIAIFSINMRAGGQKYVWINLEYLTAEDYAPRCHTLPSPVMSGAGLGLTKHFFYPGFTHGTGGLLREADLLERQARFDKTAWLALNTPPIQQTHGAHGNSAPGAARLETAQNHPMPKPAQAARYIALFCYEPAGLAALLNTLAQSPEPTVLLVTVGRSTHAVHRALEDEIGLQPNKNIPKQLSISYLPMMSQHDFDHLLWACDLNFVRGEDSLVRALWAGQPFIWQIYPQDDGAHRTKLHAFLDWLQAPSSLRRVHDAWNGLADLAPTQPLFTLLELASWHDTFTRARQSLLTQHDLADALLGFVSKTH